MTRVRKAVVLAALLQPAALALAAAPLVVGQFHRSFSVKSVQIHPGEVVQFSNKDEFVHHLYVQSPAFSFNSGEQSPDHDVNVSFPVAGTFEVRCEIHPRMLLTVTVQ